MRRRVTAWGLGGCICVLAVAGVAAGATASPTLRFTSVTIRDVQGKKANPVPAIKNAFFTLAPVSTVVLHGVASGMTPAARMTVVWTRNAKVFYTQRGARWGTPANGPFGWRQHAPSQGFRDGTYVVRFSVRGTVVGSFTFQLAVEDLGPPDVRTPP